jgi:hypothetical protein
MRIERFCSAPLVIVVRALWFSFEPVELSVCDIVLGFRLFLFVFGATVLHAIFLGVSFFFRPRLSFARALQIDDLTHSPLM